jgi:hypothetical protein
MPLVDFVVNHVQGGQCNLLANADLRRIEIRSALTTMVADTWLAKVLLCGSLIP